MPTILCLLLIGATGESCRAVDVPGQTIAGVMWQIGKGLIKDQKDERDAKDVLSSLMSIPSFSSFGIRLAIDGRPADSAAGYLCAALRVAAYVADLCDCGRVDIWRADRHYTMLDGQASVRVVRTVWEPVGRRLIPIRVVVVITAMETSAGTRFTGWGQGTKRGCVGARRISAGLADALGEIETTARQLYCAGGDPGDVADRVVSRFASSFSRRQRTR